MQSLVVFKQENFKLRYQFLLRSGKLAHGLDLTLCQLIQSMVRYSHARFMLLKPETNISGYACIFILLFLIFQFE